MSVQSIQLWPKWSNWISTSMSNKNWTLLPFREEERVLMRTRLLKLPCMHFSEVCTNWHQIYYMYLKWPSMNWNGSEDVGTVSPQGSALNTDRHWRCKKTKQNKKNKNNNEKHLLKERKKKTVMKPGRSQRENCWVMVTEKHPPVMSPG